MYVPVVNPDVLTVTEMGSVSVVVVPETAFRVSHVALSLTDQDSVPLPVFVKFTVFAVGLPAPWMAVKDRLAGLSPMVGFCTALTVIVTDMVLGVFVAPLAVMVIVALYVPATIPLASTLAESVPAPVPDPWFRLSQPVFSVAAQLSVPLPELEIETVLAAGLLPP